MNSAKVSMYARLLNESLKLRQQNQEDKEEELLHQMDLLWHSFNPLETQRAESVAKVLYNYYEGRK